MGWGWLPSALNDARKVPERRPEKRSHRDLPFRHARPTNNLSSTTQPATRHIDRNDTVNSWKQFRYAIGQPSDGLPCPEGVSQGREVKKKYQFRHIYTLVSTHSPRTTASLHSRFVAICPPGIVCFFNTGRLQFPATNPPLVLAYCDGGGEEIRTSYRWCTGVWGGNSR